jgi:hypothetical protein
MRLENPGLLLFHIIDRYFRVVVPVFLCGSTVILDCLCRAEMETCKTELAPVVPDRFFILVRNVFNRADRGADTTVVAAGICGKLHISGMDSGRKERVTDNLQE